MKILVGGVDAGLESEGFIMPNNPRDRAGNAFAEPIDTHQVPRLWGFSLPKTCFAHRCPTLSRGLCSVSASWLGTRWAFFCSKSTRFYAGLLKFSTRLQNISSKPLTNSPVRSYDGWAT